MQNFYDKEQETEGRLDAMSHLKKVLSLIDDAELDDEHQGDAGQIELIQKKKEKAKELIWIVLKGVGEYLKTVASMDGLKTRKEEYDPDAYRRMFMDADQIRKIKHEALMSDINIANRFIMKNFRNASEDQIEKWKEEEAGSGRQFLAAKRVDFPGNIVCPDYVDMNDRNQIRKWAIQIESDLSELKNGL